MMELLIIPLYIGLCVVAGAIASAKNRAGFSYFLLSALFTPIIGLLLAIGMPVKRPPPVAQPPLAKERKWE